MGTSGSEGGPGKRARSNPGTAPRSDPYHLDGYGSTEPDAEPSVDLAAIIGALSGRPSPP